MKRILLGALVVPVIALFVLAKYAYAAEAAPHVDPSIVRWGFIAAAIATGTSALGAAYAVAAVGGAAMAAVAEKPEVAGRAIVFVGLAEGIAIYGLIIAIMILGRLG